MVSGICLVLDVTVDVSSSMFIQSIKSGRSPEFAKPLQSFKTYGTFATFVSAYPNKFLKPGLVSIRCQSYRYIYIYIIIIFL